MESWHILFSILLFFSHVCQYLTHISLCLIKQWEWKEAIAIIQKWNTEDLRNNKKLISSIPFMKLNILWPISIKSSDVSLLEQFISISMNTTQVCWSTKYQKSKLSLRQKHRLLLTSCLPCCMMQIDSESGFVRDFFNNGIGPHFLKSN